MTDPVRVDLGTPERHAQADDEGNPVLRSEETAQAGVRRARVTDNISRMANRGEITTRQFVAAINLRDTYEAYASTLASPPYDGVPAAVRPVSGSPQQRSMDAGAEYRRIMSGIPATFHGILVAVVCEGMTLTSYAAGRQWHRKEARGYFRAALDALVESRSK